MLPWLEQHLNAQQWQVIAEAMARAMPAETSAEQTHRISEIDLTEAAPAAENNIAESAEADSESSEQHWPKYLWAAMLLLIGAGFYRGITQARRFKQ
jgi:hypothetical protein